MSIESGDDAASIEEITLSAIELTTALEQSKGPLPSAAGTGPAIAASAQGQVGRYELLLEIAAGGMATVYVGRQHGAGGFERLVAIKRMHPHIGAMPELCAAFMDEARIASLIRHPNVVNVHDVHDAEGEHLLVMDYVDGASLANVMRAARKREERLSRPAVIRILIDALSGLHAAHELTTFDGTPLGVVHRDATPHNILLGTDGTVRITDFGIAKAAERTVHTATGLAKGKFRYMAPEQARGRAIDRRVDVFAMGIVAWELFIGERLFQAEADAQVLLEITEGNYRRPSSVDRNFPADLDRIVMKALAPSANDRYPTAAAFAEALDGWGREHSELVSSAEIARLLHEFCGAPIVARRRSLAAVLQGTRQPPNFQAMRQTQSSSTGSNATSAPLTLDSVKVALAVRPQDMERRRLVRRLSFVAAGLALTVTVLGMVVIVRGLRKQAPARGGEPAGERASAKPRRVPSGAGPVFHRSSGRQRRQRRRGDPRPGCERHPVQVPRSDVRSSSRGRAGQARDPPLGWKRAHRVRRPERERRPEPPQRRRKVCFETCRASCPRSRRAGGQTEVRPRSQPLRVTALPQRGIRSRPQRTPEIHRRLGFVRPGRTDL